jgi:hypothetical protein
MLKWKNSLIGILLILATVALTGGTVYQQDFKWKLKARDAQNKAVKINDNQTLKYALRLETVQKKNEKPSYRVWNSKSFKVGTANMVKIDYYMKLEIMNEASKAATCYALFVRDDKRRVLVATIVRNGQLVSIPPHGPWIKIAPVKYGVWHHIRYIIEPIAGIYNIYIDDMEKPKAKNLKYRCADYGTPTYLWTESCETKPQISYFGKITVNAE